MIKKPKIIKIVIVIFIFLVISGMSCFVYCLLFCPKLSPRMDEFSLCVEEYKQVADFYYNDFKEYNADMLVYSFPYDDDDKEIVCFTEGYKHEITIDEIEYQSFSKIRNSYDLDNQYLEHVVVYDGFVSFGNMNLRSSYVYSIYDYEPKYISLPDNSSEKLYIKKLCNNWYFVCKLR